jgi:hypothetical protein
MNTEPTPDDDTLASLLRESRLLEDAPEAVVQRALGVWRERATPRVAAPGLLRRLAGGLRLDSAVASPLAYGLRSGPAAVRQLIFFSEGRDIDLRITSVATPDGPRWRIAGQVLGPDAAGTVELRSGERVHSAAWTELGEFGFGPLDDGRYTLRVCGPDWDVELPAFNVPA